MKQCGHTWNISVLARIFKKEPEGGQETYLGKVGTQVFLKKLILHMDDFEPIGTVKRRVMSKND
jgi:hypothetical protein